MAVKAHSPNRPSRETILRSPSGFIISQERNQLRNRAFTFAGISYLLSVLIWFYLEIEAASSYFPSYSFTSNLISELGVPYMYMGKHLIDYSRLAWLMNANFFITAVLYAVPQWALLFATRGPHSTLDHAIRACRVIISLLFLIGLAVVAIIHGGPREHKDGSVKHHELGATLCIVGGNLCSILSSLTERQLHPLKVGFFYRAGSLMVGIAGLLFALCLITIASQYQVGTFERLAVYMIFVWEILTAILLLEATRRPIVAAAKGSVLIPSGGKKLKKR